MALMDKGNKVMDVLIGIVLIFSLASAIIPSAQTEGNKFNADNQANCQAVGCYWNETGTDQCVNTSTAPSGDCAVTPPKVPLASLFGGSGITFVLVAIVLILLIFRNIKTKK